MPSGRPLRPFPGALALLVLFGIAALPPACGSKSGLLLDDHMGTGEPERDGGTNPRPDASVTIDGSVPPDASVKPDVVPPPPDAPATCVEREAEATLAPLDMFVMLDSSGSMEYPTANGSTKWSAVRDAFAAFFADGGSKGIGVSLSFFPVIDASVPDVCADDAACGKGSCRKLGLCFPGNGAFCNEQLDCDIAGDPGDRCEPIGYCGGDTNQACLISDPTSYCSGVTCDELGSCESHWSCEGPAYTTPDVPLEALPQVGGPFLSALDTRVPDGATPTLPALSGAIDQARASSRSNPDHKTIVVLATDGVPTVCGAADSTPSTTPAAVDEVAAAAAVGAADGLQTFVIGVFSPQDPGDPITDLNAIANAGATGAAFDVSTVQDVAAQFVAALTEVRRRSKACEFEAPDLGKGVNWLDVLMQLHPDGFPPRWVLARSSPADCDPVSGGFYFDDPKNPTRAIACPATCDVIDQLSVTRVTLSINCL